MGFIIDTNVLIDLERKNDEVNKQIEMLTSEYGGDVYITSPTVSEWFRGFIKKNKRKEGLKELDKYFLLNTSKSSSLIFAELEYELGDKGEPVSIFDLMIASICIAEKKVLVTSDGDFARIPGLSTVILLN